MLSARRADVLERLASELDARVVVADLADAGDVERLAVEAGPVDVLVANAGLPAAGEVGDYSVEQIDRALDVNLRAPIVLSRALMAGMVERRRGQLVFISSLSGKFATPGSALYSGTKSGLRAYATSLRQDLHGTGVGVSTIFPGPIRGVGMWAEGGATPPPGVGTRTPQDVANAVLRAIERDKGEVGVASLVARSGSALAQVVPSLAAAFNRVGGAKQIATKLAIAHEEKR